MASKKAIVPVAQPSPSITVNVPPAPAPQVVYLTPLPGLIGIYAGHEEVTVTAPKPLGDVKPASKKHVSKPCKVTPALQQPMEK